MTYLFTIGESETSVMSDGKQQVAMYMVSFSYVLYMHASYVLAEVG